MKRKRFSEEQIVGMLKEHEAVMRGPSFTGLGKRPALMPAHHVDLLTGIGPCGARIDGSRTKPALGSSAVFIAVRLHPDCDEAVLESYCRRLTEFGFR